MYTTRAPEHNERNCDSDCDANRHCCQRSARRWFGHARSYMLTPYSDAHSIPQCPVNTWYPQSQFELPWCLQRPGILEYLRDPFMRECLDRLCDSGRKISPFLNRGKIRFRHEALFERSGEDVGGRHGILNREVDSDAANRRHRVRRIADAQQARPIPVAQPIELQG